MSPGGAALSGVHKAAILMVLLGDDVASSIYKLLPPEDLNTLTHAITELEYISPEVAASVLQEYQRLAMTQEYLAQGGPGYATQLLKKAFGEDGAKSLLDQVMASQEEKSRNLDTLQKADPQQLAKFIEGEQPQTVALVLAHLNGKSASSVLMMLPEALRAKVVLRLAQMQQFSPEMVQKISLILHKKMMSLGEQSRRAYGGIKAVADMLNCLETPLSTGILESVEQESPQLAVSIRNNMFTFEDFLEVPETSLRELLAQLDKKTLGLALKNVTEELKNHFFKCMSTRAVEMLKEDMETMGPTRSREVSQAQLEAITLARKLEGDGKMVLKNETEDAYVV